MLTDQKPGLEGRVADAVDLVNSHSGQTCVTLLFNSARNAEVEFLANTALLHGGEFQFTAGFQTYDGSVDELTDIRAEIIDH